MHLLVCMKIYTKMLGPATKKNLDYNSLHVSAIHIYINLHSPKDFNFDIFTVTHISYYIQH
jgi:hypothetical protein